MDAEKSSNKVDIKKEQSTDDNPDERDSAIPSRNSSSYDKCGRGSNQKSVDRAVNESKSKDAKSPNKTKSKSSLEKERTESGRVTVRLSEFQLTKNLTF